MNETTHQFHEYRIRGTVDFPLVFYHQDYTHAKHEIMLHRHSQYELIYICEGSLTLYLEFGEKILLQKGDAIYIAPHQYHTGFSDNVVKECIVFDRTLLTGSGESGSRLLDFMEKFFSDSALIRAGDPIIRDTLKPLFEALAQPSDTVELEVRGYFFLFFHRLCTDKSVVHTARREIPDRRLEQITDALKLIEERYSEPLTLKQLADTAHLDERYFGRIFKSVLHKTPIEYLLQYRIAKSCMLLQLPDYSIAQIAALCGFSTPEYFSRVFRACRGMSPTEYSACSTKLSGTNPFSTGIEAAFIFDDIPDKGKAYCLERV